MEGERSRLEFLLQGYQWSQVLSSAVRLGMTDAVAAGETRAEAIATKRGLNPEAVSRLLQCLAATGVVRKTPLGFEPGPGLQFLLPGTAQSLTDLAMLGDTLYSALAGLPDTITTGQSGFERAFGEPLFKYFRSHPDTARAFNGTMSELSRAVVDRFVADFGLGDASRIVDVGGGIGHLGGALADRYEHVEVTVFDLAQVEHEANEFLSTRPRCRFQAGNFFKEVPGGGDLYLLKWILHDWPDDGCERILGNCRAVLGPQARLVVIERVVPDHIEANGEADGVLIMDIMMLALGGAGNAQERTLVQYDDLLTRTGLQRRAFTPLTDGFAAIEATATP